MHAVILVTALFLFHQVDTCTDGAKVPLDVKQCVAQLEIKPVDPAKLNQ